MSADRPDLSPLIDHALLDPHQGSTAIRQCCEEARHFGFAGVCVASRWLPVARERLGNSGSRTRLVGVVGFPFGAIPAEIKRAEAEWAAGAGADELDVVPDFGAPRITTSGNPPAAAAALPSGASCGVSALLDGGGRNRVSVFNTAGGTRSFLLSLPRDFAAAAPLPLLLGDSSPRFHHTEWPRLKKSLWS